MPIEIREHTEADIEAYVDWQTDPAVAAYTSWLPRTRSQSIDSLHDAITQQRARPRTRYFFAVVDLSSKEMVGDVGFTLIEDGVGDCGWFIRRRFWGNGYATEAVRQMIVLSFENLGLHCLKASCAKENIASRRIMQKNGFLLVTQTKTRLWYALSRGTEETHSRS